MLLFFLGAISSNMGFQGICFLKSLSLSHMHTMSYKSSGKVSCSMEVLWMLDRKDFLGFRVCHCEKKLETGHHFG